MVRILIIIALSASLLYMVSHIQPVVEPLATEKVAASGRNAPEGTPDGESAGFNPAVPTPLPDVNKGYIFSEKREYEKDGAGGEGKASSPEPGPDLLASVYYSGSMIAGNFQRALVIYQAQDKEAAPRRPSSGRNQAQAAPKGTLQKKQLKQGERFLGYVVALIEPDRIVFEKGDLKVEKFLYDRGKNRMAPSGTSQREAEPAERGGVPLQAMAPPEVLKALMSSSPSINPASEEAVGSGPVHAADSSGDSGEAADAAKARVERVVRRSQRLMGLDPSIDVPLIPVPGLPVPNK